MSTIDDVVLVFFFFKQKTAYEMRISDWSSDVCSSDLGTEYYLRINAFKEYPFYERVLEDGTPVIAEEGGQEVRDRVPTSDGQVTLFNTIRNGSTSADMLSLDSTGDRKSTRLNSSH